MKPLLFVVAMCLLSGCDSKNWPGAAETHTCSDEQMEKAQRDAAWCINNTDYLNEYCYQSAILRNCVAALEETK